MARSEEIPWPAKLRKGGAAKCIEGRVQWMQASDFCFAMAVLALLLLLAATAAGKLVVAPFFFYFSRRPVRTISKSIMLISLCVFC